MAIALSDKPLTRQQINARNYYRRREAARKQLLADAENSFPAEPLTNTHIHFMDVPPTECAKVVAQEMRRIGLSARKFAILTGRRTETIWSWNHRKVPAPAMLELELLALVHATNFPLYFRFCANRGVKIKISPKEKLKLRLSKKGPSEMDIAVRAAAIERAEHVNRNARESVMRAEMEQRDTPTPHSVEEEKTLEELMGWKK